MELLNNEEYAKILKYQQEKLDDFIKHLLKINNCFINIKNKHEKYIKDFKNIIEKKKLNKNKNNNKKKVKKGIDIKKKKHNVSSVNNDSIEDIVSDSTGGNVVNLAESGQDHKNQPETKKSNNKINKLINSMIENNNVMFFINGELEKFESNIYKLNTQEENTLYELKKIYSTEKEEYNNRKLLLLFMLTMVDDYTYDISEIEKVNESLYKNNLII